MNKSIVLTLSVLAFFITACTYSITQVHTQGTATDVVDEQQTPSTTISPDITVPVTAVPGI